MNENALFKIKEVSKDSNRVIAAESLKDHMKRPT